MRLLIVDDERPARERLRRMLAHEPGITSVTEALLLDIEMPELSGIDVAASLVAPAPLVVFVTAYDDYALRAFDAEAVDYLLKPFDGARLRRTLDRLQSRLTAAARAPASTCTPPRQLLVTERGATRIVQVADIEWLETADNYVALHTRDGAPLLRQSLGTLLGQLGPAFVRCHRCAAVRLTAVNRIVPHSKGDCTLVLHSGAVVPCSRQYRAALLDPLRPA
jgi:two-component system LytT family response regulator